MYQGHQGFSPSWLKSNLSRIRCYILALAALSVFHFFLQRYRSRETPLLTSVSLVSVSVFAFSMAAKIVDGVHAEGLLEPMVLATLSTEQLKLAAELAGADEDEEEVDLT